MSKSMWIATACFVVMTVAYLGVACWSSVQTVDRWILRGLILWFVLIQYGRLMIMMRCDIENKCREALEQP